MMTGIEAFHVGVGLDDLKCLPHRDIACSGRAMTDAFACEPAPAANPPEAYSNRSEIATPA
jgi:hypothetical protein